VTPSSLFPAKLPSTPQPAAADVVWLDDDARVIDRRHAQLLDRHWTMLGVSVAVIVLSFALQLNPAGRVRASWLPFDSLPPFCGSRAIFGINCPGCGLTRSFVALAAGDFAESFRLHRIGWLMALAVVLQVPYRAWGLYELRCGVISDRTWPTWFGNVLIAALILNWLATLIM
jgi:hypothetical protein